MLNDKINEINQRVNHHNNASQSKSSMMSKTANIAEHGVINEDRTYPVVEGNSNMNSARFKRMLNATKKHTPKRRLGKDQHLPYPYLRGRDITSGLNTLKRHELFLKDQEHQRH